MDLYQAVVDKLAELSMDYQIVEHPPALTTEEADSYIEGVRTKTMFLTNRKKTAYYLLIMDDKKRLDMDLFKELVGEKKIRMASEESLMEKMHLLAGVVSPFGLLNNEGHDIKVYIDQEIMDQSRMSFHPNTNEKTIFIARQDLLDFLESIGHPAHIIEL